MADRFKKFDLMPEYTRPWTEGEVPETRKLEISTYVRMPIPIRIHKQGRCTFVYWKDGTSTMVKRSEEDEDNPYAAFTAALAKKIYGSNSQANKHFNKAKEEEKMRIEDMIRKNIRQILEEEEARKKCTGCDCAEPDPDEEEDFTRKDAEEEQKPRISYMLKVLPEANTPKEWHPGEEMQTGIECDGYVILTFKDGKPKKEIIMNVNTEQIKVALREGRCGAKLIRAGAIMADAEIKAMGMEREVEIAERAHAQIERIKQLVEEHDRRHQHDDEDEEDD